MKWDRANKARLQSIIRNKFCAIADQELQTYGSAEDVSRLEIDSHFKEFLNSFGMKRVRLAQSSSDQKRRIWVYYHTLMPAKSKARVIVLDPWYGRTGHKVGLSIPKDVAEKFLVLGIP